MLSALLLGARGAAAQPYRDKLPAPTLAIMQQLSGYTKARDFDQIERLLPIIKPWTDALAAKFGVDVAAQLHHAAAAQDAKKASVAARHLTVMEVRDLLGLALARLKESPESAKTRMKAAYLHYLSLSPDVEFAADQRIKRSFRSAILASGLSTPYAPDKGSPSREPIASTEVEGLIAAIDKQIAEALPIAQ